MPLERRIARRTSALSRAAGPLALVLVAVGCSPAGTAPGDPSAATAPPASAVAAATRALPSTGGATSMPSPSASPAPTLPEGILLLPTEFSVAIEPGRYSSTPPFELAFTFQVDEEGWQSGHLNGEFFDLQRWDGVPEDGLPSGLLGFAHPDSIQGPAGGVAVGELTAAEAVGLLTSRDDLETANAEELSILGRDAVRVDVHAAVNNTPIFAGDDGTFRQGADLDSRLVAVPVDGGLLLLIVQARPADLAAAWDDASPIFDSVQLRD